MQSKQRVLLLYKCILKLHRGLPPEAKVLGDLYVRQEFRSHQNVQPAEAQIFLNEWTAYAVTLAQQLGPTRINRPGNIGRNMTEDDLNCFREEQLNQLLELFKATSVKSDDKNGSTA